MDDYISRQALLRDIEKYHLSDGKFQHWVEVQPSVEAEPVRQTAEWIYGEKDGADGWYCSKCGFHIPWYYEYYGLNNINFIRDFHTCPHCDSKMMKYTGMEREQNG
jgi:ribosomal protein L37AE/L43A